MILWEGFRAPANPLLGFAGFFVLGYNEAQVNANFAKIVGDLMITYEDFKKCEFKVATVKSVELHPDADRLYVVRVDLGEEERCLVAGIRASYTPEELVGKQVVVVANLAPAMIRGVESCGMILAASDNDGISVLTVDKPKENGSLVK